MSLQPSNPPTTLNVGLRRYGCIPCFILLLLQSTATYAQSPECDFVVNQEIQESYISASNLARDYIANQGTREATLVPVVFISSRQDNGQYSWYNANAVAGNIEESLGYLNDIYGAIGIEFFQLGDVHYIDHSAIENNPSLSLTDFVYQPNALCVLLPGKTNTNGFGAYPGAEPIDNTVLLRPSFV